MRYKELRAIAEYLKRNGFLRKIERVDDNVLLANFDKDAVFFDLNRSKNLIYKRDDFLRTKHYNAPFDAMLAKRCSKSRVEIELDSDDKILRIHCTQEGSYKRQKSTLQLEFTGRGANAIILDENGKVLEALHHDFHRDLRPGRPLHPIEPPKKLDKSPFEIEDMERFLRGVYEEERKKRLSVLKSSKALQLAKQKRRIEELLAGLEREEDLLGAADEAERLGNLILSNLHAIRPYEKVARVRDFDGSEVEIELPEEAKSPAHAANLYFARAKKLRQKAQNIHIQRDNLDEKLRFLERKERMVREATRPEEIEILFGKKEARQSRRERNYEKYLIDGFAVYVGKNKKGNVELLKKAKASDVWLHLKDLPSAHVIVSTNKQSLPEHVLQQAAKLCVDFSVDQRGRYLVDYTQRRNVKMRDGANVNYVGYKTLSVDKL
jgi:predicted ribosome quality control (RQC) complex YloA/Tae2 family protein